MTLRPSLAAVLVLAACGGGGRGAPRDDETARKLAEASRRCPVAELDATIVVDDQPGGATITFTTGGQPERLRAKVFALADTHNEVAIDASAGDTASGGDTIVAVQAHARPEEVPGGARIVLVAEPADVEELRDELRDRADAIASACEIR